MTPDGQRGFHKVGDEVSLSNQNFNNQPLNPLEIFDPFLLNRKD